MLLNITIYVMLSRPPLERKLPGQPARRLTSLIGAETHPTWSPDGKWIAFEGDQGGSSQIYKVAIEGGSPVRVTLDDPAGSVCQQPSWNPKNTWIVFTRLAAGATDLCIAPPGSGKPFPAYKPQGMRVASPAWSPDGSHIAYEWSRSDQILALDLPGVNEDGVDRCCHRGSRSYAMTVRSSTLHAAP